MDNDTGVKAAARSGVAPRFERGEKRRWRLVEDLDWEVGRKGSGDWVTIPCGFEFESSVPWFARWLIDPDDHRFLLAALVHDFLLETGVYGRPQAAAEWYDGARAGKAPALIAKAAFVGVAFWAVFRPTPRP